MEEAGKRMKPLEVIDRLKQLFTVERVYGEPLEVQGRTIIPVAEIQVGGGGGGGEGPVPEGEGSEAAGGRKSPEGSTYGSGMGFGFGGGAKPIGFIVVEGEETRWVPIPDVQKVLLKALGVAMAAIKIAGKVALKRTKRSAGRKRKS